MMAAGSRGRTAPETTGPSLSPGAHLRAELLRLGLDQVAVSQATGVSRQSINNIINGRQAISRAMAGKLGRLTGRSSDYWLSNGFGGGDIGDRSSVTGLLVNHQIERAIANGAIVIKPFIAAHLRTASIALTLDIKGAPRQRTVSLRPGSALSAVTAEHVELPLDYIGRLGAIARLVADGLVLSAPLQIEPGFKGKPAFGLFNAGAAAITLCAGDPVVALEIMRLGIPAA